MADFQHKRGDTFEVVAQYLDPEDNPIDLSDWTIESQLRTRTGSMVAELDVEITDGPEGRYLISCDDTTTWPVAEVEWDIQYTDQAGKIRSTDTLTVEILKDITRAEV